MSTTEPDTETAPEPETIITPAILEDSLGRDIHEHARTWDMDDGPTSDNATGISGLWLPKQKWMVVDKRNLAHHNNQFRYVWNESNGGVETVLPWVVDFTSYDGSRSVRLELPRTAGGLYQATRKLGVYDQITTISDQSEMTAEMLYPIVCACRRLDVPKWTEVSFSHPHPRLPDVAVTRSFSMGDAYSELSRKGRLPDPVITRGIEP